MNPECKWVRPSLRTLQQIMMDMNFSISPTTIERLLYTNNYALRANMKSHEPGSNHPDRDIQFEHISKIRKEYQNDGLPVISIDTKKKELIGNFKNSGGAFPVCHTCFGNNF